ncbi:tyrosine-type recombinase/integrase [Nocardia sp. NPDC059764]|uniref:tyrosine-type recombinase/integrase n=1 Tax=Nocardia sp. NPDC059764 TaxID=3346939 RepID=UPI003662945F
MDQHELRSDVTFGRVEIPRIGSVMPTGLKNLPYTVVDARGRPVEQIDNYLMSLALSDMSPLTCKSYGQDLLRWFRLLWLLGLAWNQAREGDVAALVGWMRTASNPQRRRRRAGSMCAGSVNSRTGKQYLSAGYAPTTINHCLTVIHRFYHFHSLYGMGPVINPVPESRQHRGALAHRSPLEPKPLIRRSSLRQRTPTRQPRSIPDRMWDELFAAMRNDRDRALLLFYVSSAARATELLGVGVEDLDWGGLRIWVTTKGSNERQDIPADPQAFVYLAKYLECHGVPGPGQPVFRALRGDPRPLTYWALRRILQRANDRLATNWTWHVLRHTAAIRMVGDETLKLPEIQRILRHANLSTLSVYTRVRVEDLYDKLQEHFAHPRPEITYPSGYDPDDISAVFGD